MAATRFRLPHLFSNHLHLIGVRSSTAAAKLRQYHVVAASRRFSDGILSKRNQGEWCQSAIGGFLEHSLICYAMCVTESG